MYVNVLYTCLSYSTDPAMEKIGPRVTESFPPIPRQPPPSQPPPPPPSQVSENNTTIFAINQFDWSFVLNLLVTC